MLHHIIAQSVTQSIMQSVESTAGTAIDVTQNLNQSLRVMGFGMLGIFFIIGTIILLTWLLQKLFPAKEN